MAFISPGPYSARRVFWASQETVVDWFASAANTAGWFDLSTDGVLVCGKAVRGETLIWTTVDLWAMQYIGGALLYSFTKVGNNCGIISHHAMVALDTGAYWMGTGKFFHYDGFAKPIPCEVSDYVFLNFNATYAFKVWALANPKFNEITWFYPSANATNCDRSVTYNYLEGHWRVDAFGRTCGVPYQAGAVTQCPVMIDSSGNVYDHETGSTRTGQTVYLESGPMEIGEGDQVMRVQRIVPDDRTAGDVSASLYTSLHPNDSETLNGPYTLASPTSVRLTARQVRLRITEVVATTWRVGMIRLGAIASGRR
jgi:hypothetical protein